MFKLLWITYDQSDSAKADGIPKYENHLNKWDLRNAKMALTAACVLKKRWYSIAYPEHPRSVLIPPLLQWLKNISTVDANINISTDNLWKVSCLYLFLHISLSCIHATRYKYLVAHADFGYNGRRTTANTNQWNF